MESLLFDISEYSLEAVLRSNAEDGLLFYKVSQCKDLLELSEFQVRYAIENYRLDALFLAGEFRIPYTAILRFADSGWLKLSIGYLNAHKDVDLDGVYALNFNGKISPIVRSLKEKGLPLSIIPELLQKDRREEYDDLPGNEENLEDWYDLDELDMPLKGTVGEYSSILRTKPDWLLGELARRRGSRIGRMEEVGYPELLDVLIEHELVNYPIPMELETYTPPRKKTEASRQLQFDL